MRNGNTAYIGIGGCGISILETWKMLLPKGANLIAINRDKERLSNLSDDLKTILLSEVSLVDVDGELLSVSKEQAQHSMQNIFPLLEDKFDYCDNVVLVAGLGGVTGTWGTPVLAKYCADRKKWVTIIITIPFEFESKRRALAKKILKKNLMANSLVVFDNQHLIELYSKLSILDAFSEVSKFLFKEYVRKNGK